MLFCGFSPLQSPNSFKSPLFVIKNKRARDKKRETGAVIIVCGEIVEIKGENLKAEKLSVETGDLIICGKIISIKYVEQSPKKSLFKRIFK